MYSVLIILRAKNYSANQCFSVDQGRNGAPLKPRGKAAIIYSLISVSSVRNACQTVRWP